MNKLCGNSVIEDARRAIEKLRDFADTVPDHTQGCPWCLSSEHWAGRVEMCCAPSSRAVADAINDKD